MRFSVAHQIEGRTRLRACDRPLDRAVLAAFVEQFSQEPGIEVLDLRESTGSLVVEHPQLDAEQLTERVRHAGADILADAIVPGPRDNLASIRQGLGNVDNLLTGISGGGVDMRTLAFLLLFGMGITQLLRGQIMVPAFSFFWYAFELVKRGPGDVPPGD